MSRNRSLKSLGRRDDGVAAIEFCLSLPLMLALTFGVYDVSRMISGRIDLQQAVSEGAGLAIAQPANATTGRIRTAVATAAGLPESRVTVSMELRCNDVVMPSGTTGCASASEERARFVSITINGNFVPTWTHFAVDRTVAMQVNRTVRVQ
jgi:Flp pilus assembly protein TadG